MSVPRHHRYQLLEFPSEGAVRVHPEPAALPRLRHEGPGRNRFDDPLAGFTVRYAADSLYGCLVETVTRFRPDPVTEQLLRGIDGVNADDPGESLHTATTRGVCDWLARQHVGRLTITSPRPTLVDIEQPALLDELDRLPLVRTALERSGLGTAVELARLDAAIIRLADR